VLRAGYHEEPGPGRLAALRLVPFRNLLAGRRILIRCRVRRRPRRRAGRGSTTRSAAAAPGGQDRGLRRGTVAARICITGYDCARTKAEVLAAAGEISELAATLIFRTIMPKGLFRSGVGRLAGTLEGRNA
jgi:hypothetical protein